MAALIGAAAVALPIVSIVWLAMSAGENVWPHLYATVLPNYVRTTLLLLAGVAIGTSVIGVGTAWLVAMCQFPGRRVFDWALMLPLAAPTYIIAYLYADLLDYSGPVQQGLRQVFGFTSPQEYWFPEIRSTGGAMALLVLTLYPYVYLLARAAFSEQGAAAMEAARTLGCTPSRAFFRVALPMARPAIAIGVALVLMETLNDFGTVDYFAVRTLTAGIYNTWLKMQNAPGAAQLALVMLGFVLALLYVEQHARRHQRSHQGGGKHMRSARVRLPPMKAALAALACLLPVALGFLLPAALLAGMAAENFDAAWNGRFPEYARNSFALAAGAAAICLTMGTIIAYAERLNGNPLLRHLARIAALGYAVPGAVIALGVLLPLGAIDNEIDRLSRSLFGYSTGLVFSGTVIAVLFAYLVRFFTLGFGAMQAALGRIKPSLDMAAQTLGHGPASTFLHVHLPMIRGSAITAAILVFVDVMKELPATLILRPFNFETLATHVYQQASSEQLELSSLGALTIVATGLLPVLLLNHSISHHRDTLHD